MAENALEYMTNALATAVPLPVDKYLSSWGLVAGRLKPQEPFPFLETGGRFVLSHYPDLLNMPLGLLPNPDVSAGDGQLVLLVIRQRT